MVSEMERFAIVSVYDKTGLEPFARSLLAAGVKILSTGGTARFLREKGIEVISVSDYTGHPEILDGRVKSLHPKIHGGILARRDREEDLAELAKNEIGLIDFVVVNLYPFVDQVREVEATKNPDHGSLVEVIDIGGPTMIRAAAKNCHFVSTICDPRDYERVSAELAEGGEVSLATRRELASKVFMTMSAYDGAIARYFSLGEKLLEEDGTPPLFAPIQSIVLEKDMTLRYGENPHQEAALYRNVEAGTADWKKGWKQLQGKDLSYNNLLDAQAALQLFLEVRGGFPDAEASVVIKHLNPCGVAVRDSALEAFEAARSCDPISAFGGIIAVSGELDEALAASILEGFVEVVLAERITEDALGVFKKKKNIRLLECDFSYLQSVFFSERAVVKNFADGYLLQSDDVSLKDLEQAEVVTEEKPSNEMLADLKFAWQVAKHVKSNTIVVAKDLKAIGVGAGQMSRVDAARISLERAKLHGHDVADSVAASDAFLPFPDTLEVLNDAGVAALVQPGGSIKDQSVIDAANTRKMVMITTGERHFRH